MYILQFFWCFFFFFCLIKDKISLQNSKYLDYSPEEWTEKNDMEMTKFYK